MSSLPDRLTAALSDRYCLERELGQGGMATVYLALEELMRTGAFERSVLLLVTPTVYGHWTSLPPDGRPDLYLQGLSLGALNSSLSFDFQDILADPFPGVLWSGPPFRSSAGTRW